MNNEQLHPLFQQIMDNVNRPRPETDQHPYTKEAIRQHTNDLLTGNYPFIHMTPENEQTYILAFLNGASFAVSKFGNETAPTVFLNEPKKEDIKNLSQMGEQC